MKRNLKYIIPLLVVAGTSATSCNQQSIQHLNRDSFKDEVKTCVKIADTLKVIEKNQKEDPTPGNIEQRNLHNYKVPDKGTLTVNLNVKLSGSIRMLEIPFTDPDQPYYSLDLNNIAVYLKNKITVTWDFGKGYFACTNSEKKNYFIQQDSNKNYWKYLVTPIGGTKYKKKIDKDVAEFANFKNYSLYQMVASTGMAQYNGGFGFDVSGFGLEDIRSAGHFVNVLAPGKIADEDLDEIPQIIDYLSADENITNILPITTKYTKEENAGKASASIAIKVGNFNLKHSQELADAITKEAELEGEKILADGSGNVAIDCYSSWKEDWIHQLEIIFAANKANLQLSLFVFVGDPEETMLYLNLKNVNSTTYINETFEPEFTYKTPDTSGYIDITPEE